MANPVASFNFTTAANQNPISTPWASDSGAGISAGEILSGQYICSASASNSTILYIGSPAITWPDNQVVQATLAALSPSTGFAGLNLNTVLNGQSYQLGIDTGLTPGGIGQPFSTLKFIKNGTQLATFPIILNANDVMMAKNVQGLLSFFQNGKLIGSFQDTNFLTGGGPGLTNSPYNGTNTNIAWGGTFSAAPAQIVPGTGLLVQFPVIFVPTPGKPVRVVPIQTNCNAIYFEVLPTNTGKIYIGLSNLVSSTLVGALRVLLPPPANPQFLDSWYAQGRTAMGPIDASTIFIDSDNANEGVMISYLVA
jgi:hypothetical protein